jgi:hypothetical protein
MIPKIKHQIWPGNDVFRYAPYRHTWIERCPDYSLMFWRLDFVSMLPEVNQIIASPKYTVTVKADVLRLAVLYECGGIYVDTDMLCLRNFDPLLSLPFIIGYEEDARKRIGLSIIGCQKGDQIILECLKLAVHNVQTANVDQLNKCSLPFVSIDALQPIMQKAPCIQPESFFYPIAWPERENKLKLINKDAYTLHLWLGSEPLGWCNQRIFA